MGLHARLAVDSERDALANRQVLVSTYYDQPPVLSNSPLLRHHRLCSVLASSICVGFGEDLYPCMFLSSVKLNIDRPEKYSRSAQHIHINHLWNRKHP
jgi:hypothetical protein